jgi:hypothetical protein
MNNTPIACAVALVLLTFVGTVSPALAQGKVAPEPIAEEDLGDGLRAVWYSEDKPPVIYDDASGMMIKGTLDRPVIVDQKGGFYLYLDGEGNPQVKSYGKGKGGAEPDPKALKRMRGFMKRARALHESGRLGRAGKGKKGAGKDKGAKKVSQLELLLQLLELKGEEKVALRPLLAAILSKQDEIRRSALGLSSSKGGLQAKPAKTRDLPAAIQTFLSAARARIAGKGAAPTPEALEAYRAARATQDKELAAARTGLREVLTESQEATLVAVGVLD